MLNDFNSEYIVEQQKEMSMSTNWIDPNAIVGSGAVARGSNFYLRNDIVEDIWTELRKGNSVLLVSPRRVGSTSVMQYMEEHPEENYKLFFQNLEGIISANEFFERVYTMLLNCLSATKKAKKWFENFKNTIKITKISIAGIELDCPGIIFNRIVVITIM